jgi:hypothetical protein
MSELNGEATQQPAKTGVNAPALGSEPLALEITVDGDGSLSVLKAARAVTAARQRKPQDDAVADSAGADMAAARAAEPEQPSVQAEADAALPETGVRGETNESADPALPSIAPPRSWTKEDKELFTSLPRATQERLAERERSREGDFLRRQNEAAEKLKGLTAKEQAAEQARQQYESALPILLQGLQATVNSEFADVKTWADVQKMAAEDWPRYVRWDAHQKQIAEAGQQLAAAQQRQQQERQQKFAAFAAGEDDLFKERVAEMADAKKAAELQTAALAVLKELGFEDAELAQSWNGQKDLSLRDHRVQLLVRDATLWREAQQKAKAAAAKPVPPVQRPGVAPPNGAAQDAQIQNLTKQLEQASGVNALRTAAKLVAARRAAR